LVTEFESYLSDASVQAISLHNLRQTGHVFKPQFVRLSYCKPAYISGNHLNCDNVRNCFTSFLKFVSIDDGSHRPSSVQW